MTTWELFMYSLQISALVLVVFPIVLLACWLWLELQRLGEWLSAHWREGLPRKRR